jgi:hypothetical protein
MVFKPHYREGGPRIHDVKHEMTFSGDRKVDGGTSNETVVEWWRKGGKGGKVPHVSDFHVGVTD